jgi:hypothetical protein
MPGNSHLLVVCPECLMPGVQLTNCRSSVQHYSTKLAAVMLHTG